MSNIFSKLSHSLSGSKLVLAGAAIATSAVIGSAGVAAAQSWHHHWNHHVDPKIAHFCKDNYHELGFYKFSDCVKAFQHHKGHGYGYGGHHHHHHHHGHGHGNHGDNDNQDN